MNFDELLQEELAQLEGVDEYLEDFWLASASEEELKELQEEMGMDDEAFEEYINESLVRRVNSRGKVSKVKSRKTRSQRAARTTGMSKAQLKRRAKKSARTRKRNPAALKKAMKRRKKAMRKRKQMGIK